MARPLRVGIIGSGFSGLCLGVHLKTAGFDDVTIFEKSDRLGGTWRDNTYPGAACDVPSFAYCFSFAQKTDWSRKWSPQDEIRDYMTAVAERYDLLRHVRFGAEVASARFDETESVWHVRTAVGDTATFDVLVSAVGQLNRPYVPDIPGLDDFRGERFHSARWDHRYDLRGKRVAVIGNAASAIQFIPQIAADVARLFVFQRSANWMLPRGDRAYTAREKWLFTHVPLAARLYRWWIWLLLELRFPLFRGSRFLGERVQKIATQHIADTVADERLRAALLPDYPIGGKRILISDDYYQTLARPNVELVTDAIERVTTDGVLTRDGVARPVDAIILATGFETTAFLAPMRIEGAGGRSLVDEWMHGARAYRGITVAGFPNFFMMYGPNTNLGHNSIIFMIECQTRYIMGAVRTLVRRGLATVDVRPESLDAYDARIQQELAGTVWAAPERSWYKTASGRITNNWSGSTLRYWWTTRRFDVEHYRTKALAPAAARPAAGSQAAA